MSVKETLCDALDLAVVKKDFTRGSAIAVSSTGESYVGAQVDSDTNLLSFSPEQVALLLATQNQDYDITEIVAMQYSPESGVLLSPITQKMIADFCRRTGSSIKYTLVDTEGKTIFSSDEVEAIDPLYQPQTNPLKRFSVSEPSVNWVDLEKPRVMDKGLMKGLALNGILRSFTTSDTASGYGASVRSGERIFFSGQYSSFEGRLNVHAEVAAVIASLMQGYKKIVRLAVTSSKHEHEPCYMCGSCIQFMTEISKKLGLDIAIESHASISDTSEVDSLTDLMPKVWSPSV